MKDIELNAVVLPRRTLVILGESAACQDAVHVSRMEASDREIVSIAEGVGEQIPLGAGVAIIT